MKIYIVDATVAYEGSWVVGAYMSKASAEAYIDRANKKLAAYERRCDRDPDYFMSVKLPKHFNEDLSIIELTVNP